MFLYQKYTKIFIDWLRFFSREGEGASPNITVYINVYAKVSIDDLYFSTQDPEPDPGPSSSSSSCYPHLHTAPSHKRPLEEGAEAGGRVKMSRYSPPPTEDIDDIDRKISMAGGILELQTKVI